MKNTILLLSLLLLSSLAMAKNNPSKNDSKDFSSLFNNYVEYPAEAKEAKVESTVIIKFEVEEDGSISNIKGLTSEGYNLENEAIRVLSLMSQKHKEQIAKAGMKGVYTMPVIFDLQ